MAASKRADPVGTRTSTPRYELRVRRRGPADTAYAIWQLPAPASPHVTAPVRIAGLAGRNLELVQHSVLKRLARAGVKPGPVVSRATGAYALAEDVALTLGLLFRALAPMRDRDNMRAVAEGIDAMAREGSRLLARHDHVPPASPARADGVADAADGPAPAGAGIERHETPKPRRRRRPTAGQPGTDPQWSSRSTGRTCARSAA